jgi:hypothetical protein
MASMITLVTANIASGSKETIRRTPMFAITMRGDASHTIRNIGKVLRSAARRSFQRGTGLAICGSNSLFSRNSFLRNLVLLQFIPPDYLHPQLAREAAKMLCLVALHHMPKDEKLGINRRIRPSSGTITSVATSSYICIRSTKGTKSSSCLFCCL